MTGERHILITGGAGYIGSLLTSELLRANFHVTVIDSLLFGGESLLPFLNHPNFHFVKADVAEPRTIKDALRARLTVDFIERSFDLYRKTRGRIKEHLDTVRAAGFNRVRVIGEGDVADICKLSCLEQGFTVVQDTDAPALELKGWKVILNMGDRT